MSDQEYIYDPTPYRGERPWRRWLGYAAAFAIGVVVGAVVIGRGRPAPERETASTAEAPVPEVAPEAPAAEPEAALTAEAGEDVMVMTEPPAVQPRTPAAPSRPSPAEVAPSPGGPGLPAGDVHRVVTRHLAGIQNEYRAALKNNPSLAGGKISVRFTISAAGTVTSAEVLADTVGSPAFAAAVLRRVRTWKFPRARGEATVIYPFVFVSTGA